MTLDIRFAEIITDITEDLEGQAGLVLTDAQLRKLKLKQHIVFQEHEIKPYLADITEFLRNTQASERTWECYKALSNQTYILTIHIETPFIKLDTADLND